METPDPKAIPFIEEMAKHGFEWHEHEQIFWQYPNDYSDSYSDGYCKGVALRGEFWFPCHCDSYDASTDYDYSVPYTSPIFAMNSY